MEFPGTTELSGKSYCEYSNFNYLTQLRDSWNGLFFQVRPN